MNELDTSSNTDSKEEIINEPPEDKSPSDEENINPEDNVVSENNANPEDDLDLPALKRRPKRTIRPVEDKTKLIKIVDSDDDSEDELDRDWIGKEGEGEDDGTQEDSASSCGGGGDEQSSGDSEDAEHDDEDNGEATVESIVESGEKEDEEAEPITITKEDLPFLFEARAPGKRQIKVIQYKNEIAEKAMDMSSGSSSEDEEWKAKQEDVTEQVMQEEDEEVVDMTNVPILEDNDEKPKKSNHLPIKAKSHLSHLEALEISICCVCLSGPEEDNVIECDGCGVTVHEGCYGANPTDPDNDDIDTEWFCEACVANVDDRICELCPNQGGVMKSTDSGKWAHMVCALYSDGIGFGDTTTLEPIITTDIPPSKFGFRKCDLCEDARFAYTGLVVECDAGMCKSHFHITCAQKLGYLMENSTEEVKTNPFYAYCKVHVDKDIARGNKKAYRLLQEHDKAFELEGIADHVLSNIDAKRNEYSEQRKTKIVPAVMTEKHPRALFGSVSAFSKLTKKAELFGLDTHVTIIEDSDFTEKPMKIVKPEISLDFAKQYELRQNHRKAIVARYNHHYEKVINQREEEHKLQAQIYELHKEVPKLSKKYEKIRKQAVAIWKFLSIVEPKEYDIPDCLMQKQNIRIKSHVIKKKMGLKYCYTCRHGDCPESMVDCDGCYNWYHFGCLDPPVTRNPKVNKSWAWYCTDCTNNNKDNNSTSVAKAEQTATNSINETGDSKKNDTTIKATKFGRSVKKPDHFKIENKKEKKPKPAEESPKKVEQESVVAFDSSAKNYKTLCSMCLKTDCNQKLFCGFCKKQFHLHCTCGSYDSGEFVCESCEKLTAESKKESHQAERNVEDAPIDAPVVNSQKRKNIFELQYDLMQKKKRATSESQDEKDSEPNISADKSDIENAQRSLATDDEMTENNISIEEEKCAPHPSGSISSSKSVLVSNIIKDIQIAVANVPQDSKVKLGMSPVKLKILDSSVVESDSEAVVPVNVEVTEGGSNQTILTIHQNDIHVENYDPVTVSTFKPTILSVQDIKVECKSPQNLIVHNYNESSTNVALEPSDVKIESNVHDDSTHITSESFMSETQALDCDEAQSTSQRASSIREKYHLRPTASEMFFQNLKRPNKDNELVNKPTNLPFIITQQNLTSDSESQKEFNQKPKLETDCENQMYND